MYKIFLGIFILLINVSTKAQDTLVAVNSDSTVVEISKIEGDYIYYQFSNFGVTKSYRVKKMEIAYIYHKDGRRDTFNGINTNGIARFLNSSDTFNASDYELGMKHGSYLTQGTETGLATGITTVLCSPCIGVITAGVITSGKVSESNLRKYPNYAESKSVNYKNGFKEGVRKNRNKEAWRGFGIGSAVWVMTTLAMSYLSIFL